ncbi:MAG: CatA-like O-acetyltransferase [Eubacteriales bacterium]|nr:CatA-like O-acetyltransferase [Eubacteriales bacterium]
MKFTEIDLMKWPRGQMFYYFSKMAPTGYSLTANVDVTKLRDTLKANGLKFFPAYIWLVTRNLNKQTEFKVAVKEGRVGYYDVLTTLYAHFHDDDNTISLMWAEYSDSFMEFYGRYIENQKEFGGNHGVLGQPLTPPPENAYTVSCIPWVSFSHFAVHSYENKPYYFPSVEAGKFYEKDGRTMMPLSLTCHHATTDGYHINRFLKDLQMDMDSFDSFL